jgi:hypothetical protein
LRGLNSAAWPENFASNTPGAVYHFLNRGDRREATFRTDPDRVLFLDPPAEACQKTGWQVHAFCLTSG